MADYDVEVKLLAVTRLQREFRDEIPLVAHQGEPEYLIEHAGRLCYATEDKIGTKPGWIQERIKDGHETIIEHASATFYIRCSRVVTHELVRHRLASYSQRSQRYVKEYPPKYIIPPELDDIEIYDDRIPATVSARDFFLDAMAASWHAYWILTEAGLPREIARYVLPGACETQIICTWNFRELRHIIRLRTSKRALPEMQVVAGKIREICKEIAPQVFEDL